MSKDSNPTSVKPSRGEQPQEREFEFVYIKVDAQAREARRRSYRGRCFSQAISATVDLEMVYLPNGIFHMGSPQTEIGRDSSENPRHWRAISTFFMGKFPVTQAQWQVVAAFPQISCDLNPNPAHFKGDNRPVESISWFEAVEFCDRLSHETGVNYRLPSEAEWEYACRGGTNSAFSFGETISTDLANYDGTYSYGFGSNDLYRQETTPVGSFEIANPYGLYDMHGLVWEWCADSWHENYQGAPSTGKVWDSSADDPRRVVRGGSWFNAPSSCRSSSRNKYLPDIWLNNLGFRVTATC
jgi:formylglycine-generating enzyme required for sulfatase activity